MRKRTRLFPICVLIGVFIAACAARMDTDNAPTKSDPSIAQMELPAGAGTCTAWRIGKELVATAGHCCATTEEELAEVGEGAYKLTGPHSVPGAELMILVDDDEHDVCIMKGEMTGAPIPLALRDPAIGDHIWTAGYPRGKFIISDGFWSGRDVNAWGLASNFVSFGASGSPLMDNRGRAVGIVVMLLQGNDNIALIATVEHVRAAALRAYDMLHAAELSDQWVSP